MIHTLCDGKYLRMVSIDGWECVQRKNVCGIVGILAVTPDNKLILVEQFRPPVNATVVEIPAGLAGDQGAPEDLAEAARRELEEETGYRAAELTLLTAGAASAGLSDEIITLFRAAGVTKVGDGGGDEHEDIQVHEVPLDQVQSYLKRRAAEGAIIDLKVYAALCFLSAQGDHEQNEV